MEVCPVVRVKTWGTGQGDFVEINESDFNADLHELLDSPPDAITDQFTGLKNPALKDWLTAAKIDFPANINKAELLALCRSSVKG